MGDAFIANQVVSEVEAIGSITLNGTVGGLSPRSVISAVKAGAKVVWLPTVDAEYGFQKGSKGHWISHYIKPSSFGYPVERLVVTDETGCLRQETQDILRICSENSVALCSGHISPEECIEISKEAKAIGFKQFEITHANAWIDDFTIDVMKQLAANGAYISLAFGACSPMNGRQDPHEIANIINAVGAKHCILITDYGQSINPSPTQAFRAFYYLLKSLGVSAENLDIMMKKNPALLLNLS
jgi:hypothetical protein